MKDVHPDSSEEALDAAEPEGVWYVPPCFLMGLMLTPKRHTSLTASVLAIQWFLVLVARQARAIAASLSAALCQIGIGTGAGCFFPLLLPPFVGKGRLFVM